MSHAHSAMRFATLSLLIAALSACTPEPAPAPTPPVVEAPAPEVKLAPQVVKAVAIAKAIDKAPENAATILADNGMDAAALDDLMYEIASSAELSAQYEAARKG